MTIFIIIRYGYHRPAKFIRRRWPLESVSSPTDRSVYIRLIISASTLYDDGLPTNDDFYNH